MDSSPKSRSRRADIRKNRPDCGRFDWQQLKAAGVPASVGIAAAFFVLASVILLLRQDVIPYRPDQPINHDIVARVGFTFRDKNKFALAQQQAREAEPRVYQVNPDGDAWDQLRKDLLALPEKVAAAGAGGELPAGLKEIFDPGSLTALKSAASKEAGGGRYEQQVGAFVDAVREWRNPITRLPLIVVPDAQRKEDVKASRPIRLTDAGRVGQDTVDPSSTTALADKDALRSTLGDLAKHNFPATLQPKLLEYALARLQPTHVLDEQATNLRRNNAVANVKPEAGQTVYHPNDVLVHKSKGVLDHDDWLLLRAENAKYVASLSGAGWKPKLGTAGVVFIVTVVLSLYVALFQPRVMKNHARALAIAALLLSMLLLAALAGIGNGPIYVFGIAPTLLVAMILTIAYDQRFSIGVASVHGLLVTVALDQGVAFFIIQWVGVLTGAFLLNDIRTRSKLIEVGGLTALTMIAACGAGGMLDLEGKTFILRNCLYAGAAGLAVGFIVLGILPFIERAFKITTSMTLLELADITQPLLKRLAIEAPGTYSHSLQVATLSEAAAETVGANSLLCRVGSYYHDVGKIHKAEYFIENMTGGESRHINLTPSVSCLIIRGHVKDGVEMAREYNLPPNIIGLIQQHHGTTLVEYFYRQACARQTQCDPQGPVPAEHEFRYEGPKPKTKEAAIVMIADAVESTMRSMKEPTAGRVEDLVHSLTSKRLADGQFDECDLTIRDLAKIERSMVKTLMSIYHGRVSYPSTAGITDVPSHASAPSAAVKTA